MQCPVHWADCTLAYTVDPASASRSAAAAYLLRPAGNAQRPTPATARFERGDARSLCASKVWRSGASRVTLGLTVPPPPPNHLEVWGHNKVWRSGLLSPFPRASGSCLVMRGGLGFVCGCCCSWLSKTCRARLSLWGSPLNGDRVAVVVGRGLGGGLGLATTGRCRQRSGWSVRPLV